MPKNVLVVDDDETVRDSFILALEKMDCLIDCANNGEEGLDKARSGKYDLIFLDFNMPKKNGAEVLRGIREVNREVPIYIVTAYEKEFVIDINIMMGKDARLAYELFLKPINQEKIRKIVRHALNLSDGKPAASVEDSQN